MSVTNADVLEIRRLSENKSIRKLSQDIRKDLDQETLSKLMSAYLVLKANGHSDSDFVNYLTRKQTGSTFKLGFKLAAAVAPSLLTDGEFRSLVMNTRKEMKKEKREKEQKQKEPQEEAAKAPKNRPKVTMNNG
ncbi:MAG: hypothetical protein ACYC7D_04055 [Nitrososphaerales archaeon]